MPDVTLQVDGDVTLRPLAPSDVGMAYVDGLNRPEVNAFLESPRSARQTLESVRAFVQANADDPAAVLFGIFVGGRHSGNLRLHDIGHDAAWMGIAIFDPACWGRGLGSRVIRCAADHALHGMDLAQVRAGIDLRNGKSIAAFERAGFRRIAVAPGERPAGSGLWVYALTTAA